MYIARIQYKWKQAAGSYIARPVPQYYNLFHFVDPVELHIGEEVVYTQPNACIISRPKGPRGFYFREDTVMNWIHMDASVESLLEKYNLPVGQVFYPDKPEILGEQFVRIRREFACSNPYREELLDSYLQEFLIRLSRSLVKSKSVTRTAIPDDLWELRGEMIAQPTRNWSVEELASRMSVSPSRFHAVYKASFGASPMKELIAARMELAKSALLRQSDVTMPQIAEQLGYNNQYHFIRQFKAHTGMTPGAYRKQAGSP